MARRPVWYRMAESARDEALNAVEFFNRPAGRRPLETFLVHMHIAWTYLLHAEFFRDGLKPYYRDPKRPTRYVKVDGQRKTWELDQCIKERWPGEQDPVRQNLELTIRLRNKVEHRYEEGLIVTSTGFTQALIMNFEEEIVQEIGPELSIADLVHIPVSLATFSREGVARLMAAQAGLPRRLKEFFVDFRSSLAPEVAEDRRFEFRVDVVQKRSPKSEADLAVTFVNESDLTKEELAAYEELEKVGRIVIREKERPVANLGNMKPKAASEVIEQRIPFKFRPSSEFPRAWKHFSVRPSTSAKGAARKKVDERYCIYDEAHDDYVYRPAFVELLVRECATEEGFTAVIGRPPTPK